MDKVITEIIIGAVILTLLISIIPIYRSSAALVSTAGEKNDINENIEEKKFKKGNEKFLQIKSRVYKYMGSHSSINRVSEGVMYIIIVVAGAFALVNGKIEAPDYIAYLLYITTLLTSIRKIIDFAEYCYARKEIVDILESTMK